MKLNYKNFIFLFFAGSIGYMIGPLGSFNPMYLDFWMSLFNGILAATLIFFIYKKLNKYTEKLKQKEQSK